MAVVDIGTNSTRLLIADVGDDGGLEERRRESIVTRLGAKVDATGRLQDDAMQRVFDTLARFRELIDEHGVTHTTAVLTSAVRDAANGPRFAAIVRERYDLDARTIGGDEEAALTFAGATSERPDRGEELLVVDIGGGSTEFVTGCEGSVDFHVSTQAGVVRQTERHIAHDPPRPEEVDRLRREVAQIIRDNVPPEQRARVALGIAVAGTATSCAAIELGLHPYDRALVHGHVLRRAVCADILDRLARLTDAERRDVTGLQPDRAPTIVAGVAMLLEVIDAFGLDAIEVSEHDILRGAALRLAANTAAGGKDGRTSESSRP
ncbi:MAG: Ppx/GppA family phosphatase [Solirubrobacteraceae bacterium]|nr:Ppx/GppA family phosphatase [Solirubrobacteraceae bacterium]